MAFPVMDSVAFAQEQKSEKTQEEEKTQEKEEAASEQGEDQEKESEQDPEKEADQDDEKKNEGQADLDKAFDLKSSAETTRDLDAVCDLCKSAIEKGLEKEVEDQAKELWAGTLYEHAENLSQNIFPPNTDRRWKVFRRQALSRLDEAVELQPDSVDCFILLARLRGMGGDRAKAREAIMKAVELAGNDTEKLSKSLVIRGALSDDPATRLADFNQAVKIDPTNVDAIRSRASQYLVMGKLDKAINDFELWIEAEPDNLMARMGAVDALVAEDRIDEAIERLGEAIEIDPENSAPYSIRARLHLQTDKYDEAFDDAEQALKINKDDVEALMVRSSVQTDREKYQEALDDVNRVLKLEPGLVRGIWMRSILSGQLEDYDQAIEDIQLLVNSDPTQSQFKTQLAMLYNAADRPEDAVEIYNDLIEDDSEDIDALRGRGDAHLSLSKHKEAVADYENALEIDEKRDGVLNNLAWVLATSPDDEVRDGQKAVDYAKRAAELTEYKQAHILSTLASGYAEMGEFEKAKEWVNKALEISNDEKQREGLAKELASYESDKPWREDQLKELEEKREKADDEDDSKKDE
jgi:tetratricopeptide (TPR) repeat protein